MKPVVFDFDKTLTNYDTLFGFYREVDGSSPDFHVKRAMLFVAALVYKARLMSNDKLKSFGIWLFLRGKTHEQIECAACTYAHKIKLNKVYEEHFLSVPQRDRIVISASLVAYLEKCFPDELVAGSALLFSDGRVAGLAENMYGEQKLSWLSRRGIDQCRRLFTDSVSDRPLMDVAIEVFLVDNGVAKKVKG